MNIHGEKPPSWYDPPSEPRAWPCAACDESGYLCSSLECFIDPSVTYTRRVRTELCFREHQCPMCQGEGLIYERKEREWDV